MPHATLAALVRQSVQSGTRPWLRVTSGSMAPWLRAGDEVAVEAIHPQNWQPGDVLVLDEGVSFLTHRLRRVMGEMVQTRGDRLLMFDAPVHGEQVVGRVTAVRRNGTETPLNPALNEALHQLACTAEQWIRCLRLPGQPITLVDRVWHKLYFYWAWWLISDER